MNTEGSNWHRWDMHIHTPGTLHNDGFEGDWQEYQSLVASAQPQVSALGITDYFTLRSYKTAVDIQQQGGFQGLWLFPNIELRLDVQAKQWLNFHLIFSPEDPGHIAEIERLLSNLEFTDSQGEIYKVTDSDLIRLGRKSKPNLEDDIALLREGACQFKVSINDIRKIQKMPWAQQSMITAVSSKGKDGTAGIRRSAGEMAESIEAASNIIFSGSSSDRSYWLAPDNGMQPKPVVFSCDAHKNEDILKPNENKFCWFKGDIGFDTLRQMLLEPERRVFIGERPASASYATIKSISLDNADWFPEDPIPINDGLVAIIGARGSGKTALADLISLGASTVDFYDNQSFITRARPYLDEMAVNLQWSGGTSSVSLNDITGTNPDNQQDVKYLSQHFVSRICSSDQKGALQNEIEQMIFNALNIERRRNCSSFQELEHQILSPIHNQKNDAKSNIAHLNQEIETIAQRLQNEPSLRASLITVTESLQKKNADIEGLLSKSTQSRQDIEAITAAMARISNVRSGREQQAANLNQVADRYQTLIQKLRSEQVKLSSNINSIKFDYHNLGLDAVWDLLNIEFPAEVFRVIEEKLAQVRTTISTIDLTPDGYQPIHINNVKTLDEQSLNAVPTIYLNSYQATLSVELEKLGIHQEAYQTALQQLEQIKVNQASINESIVELERLKTSRAQILEQRRNAYLSFFGSITDEERVLEQLHEPLTDRLKNAGGTCEELEFYIKRVVDMEAWLTIGKNLFDNRMFNLDTKVDEAGLLNLFEQGNKEQIFDAIQAFITENHEAMKNSSPQSFPWENNNRRNQLIAEWLFSIEHISLEHGIRYQGVNLEQLSSGTKGIVLLLLYLVVDINDPRPLIIDQPEENLDPNSIFEELVRPFRDIRNKRQVIIVTHNANLVVNTDADQVIVARNEVRNQGEGLPHFRYTSGAIENKHVRDLICKTLEGGEEAFLDREKRYRLRSRDQLNL